MLTPSSYQRYQPPCGSCMSVTRSLLACTGARTFSPVDRSVVVVE
jgi:hypothetical protein